MPQVPLYLASSSPRRRELLAQLGLHVEVVPAAVDESPLPGEMPEAYVERLARAKAQAGLSQIAGQGLVIAADTTVALGADILGKPADYAEARVMWQRLAAAEHRVLTGVAVGQGERIRSCCVCTWVRFHALSEAEMQAYWATGEPADKAGGYGIQGRAAVFVEEIRGSYSNVVGLPLSETAALMADFGYSIWK